MNDFKFALRQLLKNPGFTAVAVLTLALGIGANTAMFSLLHALLFQPLPYPESDRLVRVFRTSPQSQSWPHSAANFLDRSEQNAVFAYTTAFSWWGFNCAEPGQPAERLQGVVGTGDFFLTLGVPAALGRVFTSEDDQPGRNQVAVISHRLWQQRFGGDTNVLGRTLRVDGEGLSIIGVMPPGFGQRLWSNSDVWKPLGWTPEQRAQRGNNWLNEMARLKPGVSIRQAQSAMSALAARLAQAYPNYNAGIGLRVVSLLESATHETRQRLLWLTFGLTTLVLLIACANLANLQLARTVARSRELAVRAALGAGRGRLARQLMTESLLLSTVGGGLGVLLALGSNQFLGRQLGIIDKEPDLTVPLNATVLAFAALCSMLTTVLFGTVPPGWHRART